MLASALAGPSDLGSGSDTVPSSGPGRGCSGGGVLSGNGAGLNGHVSVRRGEQGGVGLQCMIDSSFKLLVGRQRWGELVRSCQPLPKSESMAMCFREVLNAVQNRGGERVSSCTPGPTDCKRLPRVRLERVSEDATGPRGKDQLTMSAWTWE